MNLIGTRPEYPPEWDDQDDKEAWIDNRVNELLETECDPLKQVNLAEFIGDLNPNIEAENELLIKLHALICKHTEEFKPILEANCDYWTKAAEKIAEHEFDSGEFFDDGEP